jgi:hypothetical protein
MLAASSQNTAWRNAGARRLDVKHAQRHAELGGDGALARGNGKAGVAAIELEPPGVAQVSLGTRLRHQRLVLADRAAEQRPHRPHGLDEVSFAIEMCVEERARKNGNQSDRRPCKRTDKARCSAGKSLQPFPHASAPVSTLLTASVAPAFRYFCWKYERALAFQVAPANSSLCISTNCP